MARALSHPVRRLLVACVALTLAATGCGGTQRPPRQTGNAIVPVMTAATGTVAPKTLLSGTIAPLQNVGITSTLSEPADEVNVQEGDHVRKGELLAQLDTADLRAQLAADIASAQSSRAKETQTYDQAGLTIAQNSNTVNAGRAAVRQAQVTLNNDQLTLQRDAVLLKQGYIAQSQYDLQATTVKNDQQAVQTAQVTLQNDVSQVKTNGTTSSGLQGANVAAAQADVQTALAQADQIRVQIAKAAIVSPIDGVVVNRNLNPGEFPGTRTVFTVQAIDHVYAVLNGAGSQVVGVRNGSTVDVTSDLLPGKHTRGTVVGVLNAVQPGTTNFVLKVLIDNGRNLLRPGMVVSGTASLPGASGIRVPITAFLDTTNSTLQVVHDGTAQTVHVTMIAADDKNAIVTGLPAGSVVISNGQLGLADGQRVQPQRQVAEK
ncbi:MAG TPA: efflux RND transporter periplasmic adaptor subunit [Candidatus Elarobacter sp.]|nr:efflux RND transporter periplasmic adaptor subunit [Candidatus Elarobacter sp.]